jgi:hypothetical protein
VTTDEAIARATEALKPFAPAARARKFPGGFAVILDKEPVRLHGHAAVVFDDDPAVEDLVRVIAEAVADLTANPL